MSAVQQVDLLTLPPVAGLPTREALAAWLELEAALISATKPGTEERKRLRLAGAGVLAAAEAAGGGAARPPAHVARPVG